MLAPVAGPNRETHMEAMYSRGYLEQRKALLHASVQTWEAMLSDFPNFAEVRQLIDS